MNAKGIFFWFFLWTTCTTFGQNVDDLVPFRKGKKWGLVHRNMTAFYPPTLDSVILSYKQDGEWGVFAKDRIDDKSKALVLIRNKYYHLSPGKKLTPTPSPFEGDAPPPAMDALTEMPPANNNNQPQKESVQTRLPLFGDGAMIVVKKKAGALSIYKDGNEMPHLQAEDYKWSYQTGRNSVNGAFLLRNGHWAYADLYTEKILTPFSYQALVPVPYRADWLIATNNRGLKGLITTGNDTVTGFRFADLITVNPHRGLLPFIAKPEGAAYSFYFPEKDSLSKSQYDGLSPFITDVNNDILFKAERNGHIGLTFVDGKELIPITYDDFHSPTGGLLWLERDHLWGFFNLADKYRKEPVYEEVREARALGHDKNLNPFIIMLVRKGQRWFYVDNHGKEYHSE